MKSSTLTRPTACSLSLDNDPATRTPTIELAHEAIIREWERLRAWLNESRDDIKLQRQLSQAADEWKSARQDSSFLATGSRLETFEKWAGETQLALTPLERDFLQASLEARIRQAAAEQARQEREQRLERRSRTFLRALVGVFAAAAVIATILSLVALNQSRIAQDNADQAERNALEFRSLALTNAAQQELYSGLPDSALALALEANRMDNPPSASQQMLFEAGTSTWIRHRFTGHAERLFGVAYGPDSRMVVTTGWDNNAILWDISTHESLKRLEHTDILFDTVFHPDGNLVAIGTTHGTIILWNIETDETRYLNYGEDYLWALCFSPDGRWLLAGGIDPVATLWNVETGELVRRFEGHTGWIVSTTFNSDGSRIMTGSVDNTARIWDVQTGDVVQTLIQPDLEPQEERTVLATAFLPDNERVITGGVGAYMYMWSIETGEILHSFEGHRRDVFGISLSPDGKLAVTGENTPDSRVLLWDVESQQLVRTYEGHTGRVQWVAFSPDGKSIMSVSTDKTAILWDAQAPGILYDIPTLDSGFALAISPDGQSFIEAGASGIIHRRDIRTGELLRTYDEHEGMWPFSLAISPDGRTFASGDYLTYLDNTDQNAYIWDSETGEVLHTLDQHDGYVTDIAFSPDGHTVATAEAEGGRRVLLWDVETGQLIQTFEGHGDWVMEVVFSPDGQRIYSSSRDNTIREWDIATGAMLRVFEGHTNRVEGLDISPDGTRLLSASDDHTVKLWDIASGTLLHTFVGHTDRVFKVRFSPDGQLALSSSRDTTLILWDIASGRPLWRLVGHRPTTINRVWGEFSPDGQTIISVSGGGEIIGWDVPSLPHDAVSWTQDNRYIPDFTCDQRALYRIEPLCAAEEQSPAA